MLAQQILSSHNRYRKIWKVPELKLSESLSKYSQMKADMILKPTGTCKFGENMYFANTFRDLSRCVDHWMCEGSQFENNNWEERGMTHFSQCIWANTKLLGIGFSCCEKNKYVVICNYDPVGNISGENPYETTD